jgi:putative FmdB family regulatory protein
MEQGVISLLTFYLNLSRFLVIHPFHGYNTILPGETYPEEVLSIMPVYTYRCENCGVQFERTQKFSEASLTVCPECGKKTLHKVYTPVGIVFKGSGFYATDHRSPSGAPRTAGGRSSEEKSTPTTGSSENTTDRKSVV